MCVFLLYPAGDNFARKNTQRIYLLQFQCCGVNSYSDWSKNIYFNLSDHNPSLEAGGVPFSCCKWLKNEVRFCQILLLSFSVYHVRYTLQFQLSGGYLPQIRPLLSDHWCDICRLCLTPCAAMGLRR